MNKRDQGRKAVETMLKYGVPVHEIREILRGMPTHQFTNGALERLLEELHKPMETANGN